MTAHDEGYYSHLIQIQFWFIEYVWRDPNFLSLFDSFVLLKLCKC
jgi:hypothetical protein